MEKNDWNVLVTAARLPLRESPSDRALVADELISGGCARVVRHQNGWLYLLAEHRYSGWTRAHGIRLCKAAAACWRESTRMVVTASCCDLQSRAAVRGVCIRTLLRGSLVRPAGEPVDGWQPVRTAEGLRGFLKQQHVAPYPMGAGLCDTALRESLVATAMSYMGCCYRWGGKTPLGIDCSGLVSQCYLMHGITIWRDASIKDGFAMRPILKQELKPADLLYWPGHVAMYIGGGRYIHSNATYGGVCINSLDPSAPDYRPDLGGGGGGVAPAGCHCV